MHNFNAICTFCVFLLCGTFHAQTLQVKNDTIGGNVVTYQMPESILSAIAKAESCNKPKQTNDTSSLDTTPKVTNPSVNTSSMGAGLSTAEICQRTPKLMGYKIQIGVTNNLAEANKIRLALRQKFPELRVELDSSLRPNYRILAGSYFSKQSAAPDLKKVRASFGSALIVIYRIFCVDAK